MDLAKRDPRFAAEMAAAQEEADAKLLMEARRRAVEGTSKGIFQKGQRVTDSDGKPASEQVYSDRLLELLLKSRYPADFIERRAVEHSSAPSGWQIGASDLHCLNDEETEWLQRIMSKVMTARGEIEPDPAIDYADAIEADFSEVEEEAGITDEYPDRVLPY
ncbi:MAG: hypothetical protein WEA84_16255 [Rhodovibrionaceae bacterium]